jgi:hypothetical protein
MSSLTTASTLSAGGNDGDGCRSGLTGARPMRSDSAREAVRRLAHRIRTHTEAGETNQADRLRTPLDRNQVDVARLEQEITAAAEEAAKYTRELAGRPDGPQAKADVSPRAQPWTASRRPSGPAAPAENGQTPTGTAATLALTDSDAHHVGHRDCSRGGFVEKVRKSQGFSSRSAQDPAIPW